MDDGVVNDRAGNDSHNVDNATIVFEDEYRYSAPFEVVPYTEEPFSHH